VTALEQPSRDRPRRRRRRRFPVRALLALALGVLVFLAGIAFGYALRDDPEPGGTVTIVRTLEPLPQRPAG
jgi:hypothetical protein